MTRARNGFATLTGVAVTAMLVFATVASALGPGGWGNLGDRGSTMPTFSALDGRADVLNTDMPGKLIAGGAFTAAGVPAATTTDDDHIAIWDGRSWSPLGAGAGLNGDARALAFKDGKIYAGGIFFNAGGNASADALAVWDTTAVTPSWQPICATPGAGGVGALEIIGNTLYIGGAFQNWAGIPQADYLAACDLTSGTASAMVTTDGHGTGPIQALATDSNGVLYAGGNFSNWGTIAAADYVVKYADPPATTASSLGANPAINTIGVDSLAAIGTDLYVGTDDVDVDGIAQADNIVKWNGSVWSAAGANTAGTNGYFSTGLADVQALTASGSTVFASGDWSNANGEPLSDGVARFDASCVPVAGAETCWDNVGSNGALNDGPLTGNLHRGLAVFNNSLIVGGNFANAGGDPLADSIACFPLPLGATPCILPPSDTTAPQTTITKANISKAKRRAKFTFTSSESKSTFSCKLDKKPFKDCVAPKTYTDVKRGEHTFAVRATDRAGNTDATAAKRKFKI